MIMVRKPKPDDVGALVDSLGAAELRQLVAAAQQRLSHAAIMETDGLTVANLGKAAIGIAPLHGERRKLAAEATLHLTPQAPRPAAQAGDEQPVVRLAPAARGVIAIEVTTEAKAAVPVRIDLDGWRRHAARHGAPELLVSDGAGWSAAVGTRLDVEVHPDRPLLVVVVGRGPTIAAPTLAARLLGPATSEKRDAEAEGPEEPQS
jgi:hypothetical protein